MPLMCFGCNVTRCGDAQSAPRQGDLHLSLVPVDSCRNLEQEWRQLEAEAAPPFFLSWLWIDTWLQNIDRDAFVIRVHRNDKLIALGLLCHHRQVRHRVLAVRQVYINTTGDHDQDIIALEYNGLLAKPEDSAAALDAVLRALLSPDAALAKQAGCPHEVVLPRIDAAIEQRLTANGLAFWKAAEAPSYWIDLDRLRRDGSAFLDSLSRNTRHQIRRSIRLYEQGGAITVQRAENPAEVAAFMAGMQVFHQAAWQGRGHRGAFSYPFLVAFHQHLIAAGTNEGAVDILKISTADQVIGYIYNFIYRNTVYYYMSGFAYEADNKLKPGLVCHAACVAYYGQRGLSAYDFMAGNNRYKASLGQEGPVLITAVVQRRVPKLMVEAVLRRLKGKLTAMLKQITRKT